MANRSCRLCFVKLPRAAVLSHSDDLFCPSCHTSLELSRHSRVEAALFGALAGYVAAKLMVIGIPNYAWVLAVVASVLAYGFCSALFLYFLSDLTIRPIPVPAPFPQTHG